MKKNVLVRACRVLAPITLTLAVIACDTPADPKSKSPPPPPRISLAKFNAVTVDPSGNSGMTAEQVGKAVGIKGVSSEKSGVVTYKYQDPKDTGRYIQVEFNKDKKASKKAIFGIKFLTLEKSRAIKLGTIALSGSTPTFSGTASTLAQINADLGVNGQKQTLSPVVTNYMWTQGGYADSDKPEHRITISFLRGEEDKAFAKLVEGPFPGMLTKEKYDQIQVNSTSPAVTGSTLDQVQVFMEYLENVNHANTAASGSTKATTTRRWHESDTKYVEVVFEETPGPRGTTIRNAVSASAQGIPGAMPK